MSKLDLSLIASRLEGLEETIISKLLDRAQWRFNQIAYVKGKSGFEGDESRSLLEIRLSYQEEIDVLFGKYCVPEERPFNKSSSSPHRIVYLPDSNVFLDDFQKINLTSDILSRYILFLPDICLPGDDGQYGSSVEHDVFALQAISKRIHYGALYIAECKYQSSPAIYNDLISRKDADGLLQKLTRPEVENKIIKRIAEKTNALQKCANIEIRNIISAESVVNFYRNTIIPLTKKGEVLYLLNRKQD